MANAADLDRAREGREVWNAWAEENPGAAVDFSAEELREIDFRGFEFPEPANFSRAIVHENVSFTDAVFHGDAVFDYSDFLHSANLRRVRFEEDADFSHAVFRQGDTNFSGATFEQNANFVSATFDQGAVHFRGTRFVADVVFTEANFHRAAVFAEVMFGGKADFCLARFSGSANFQKARFSEDLAIFASVKFFRLAHFENARFGKAGARFSQAEFHQSVKFDEACYAGYADFQQARFSGLASFKCSKFCDFIAFNDAQFATVAVFQDSTFQSVPTFHGATLHEGTTFEGVTWPKRPHKGQSPYDAARAWARLRVEMSRLHKHEDELSFFTKELRARARDKRNEPRGKRLLYWIYLALGAGRNVLAPFGWLVGLNALLFLPMYWSALTDIQGREGFMREIIADAAILKVPPDVVSFWLGQALPFIGASNPERRDLYRRLFAGADSAGIDMPLWLELVGILQQFVGIVLVFMIGLALRNRFRMK
jgi:uncharacterized protein YjbI with pentapeptide repeats